MVSRKLRRKIPRKLRPLERLVQDSGFRTWKTLQNLDPYLNSWPIIAQLNNTTLEYSSSHDFEKFTMIQFSLQHLITIYHNIEFSPNATFRAKGRFDYHARKFYFCGKKKKLKDPLKTHSEHRALLNGSCDSRVWIAFFISAMRSSHGRLLDGCVGFQLSFDAIYRSLMKIIIRARLRIFLINVCPKIWITHLSQYPSEIG